MSKTLSETEPLNLFNLLHNTTTFNLLHNTTHRNLLQNTTTPNRTNNQPILSADSFWTLPIFIIFIISGVFGNCLVCLAISTNRELQSMTNFFLMSLAVADLLVCMIVMPFGAIVFFIGSWPLSQFWCIFYQTCDVLACSVSILHLMFISIGRYRGIRRPLQQRSESEHSTLFKVVLTWGLGMLLASPIPVLALVNMENVMPEEHICEMNNKYFLVIGSLLSFYIPMVIMVTTYVLTVHYLKKKQLGSLAGKRHVGISNLVANTLNATGYPGAYMGQIAGTSTTQRCCRRYSSRGTQTELTGKNQDPKTPDTRNGRNTILSALPFLPKPPKQQTSTVSEEKATRVLGVVFSTFVICWAPFFIMNLVVVLCGEVCVPPPFIGNMALWLGYASSTINPLIYTVFNIKFRRSFGKLLLCRTNSFLASNTSSSS